MNLFVLGQAGSGKTTFCKGLAEWLQAHGLRAKIVNLDPGVKHLPYEPAFDLRNWITVEQIMEQRKLGPNAAILEAMEYVAQHAASIAQHMSSLDVEFVLIDTPGQLEVFAFHEAGKRVLQMLPNSICAFLIDGEKIASFADFAIFYLVSLALELRFALPWFQVVTKHDLINPTIKDALSHAELLEQKLKAERGMLGEVAQYAFQIVQRILPHRRLVFVNSLTKENFEQVYDVMLELKCVCGDLT